MTYQRRGHEPQLTVGHIERREKKGGPPKPATSRQASGAENTKAITGGWSRFYDSGLQVMKLAKIILETPAVPVGALGLRFQKA
jgi:hypothetical protein